MNGKKRVEIFTDGACSGNPGPGGWGAVLLYGNARRELCGGDPSTTNNRMELTACINALKALREPCEVTLTADSKYIVDAVNLGWAAKWRKNNWIKSDKKPALNADLWEQLLDLCAVHDVSFRWVKGHAGNRENERCDRLATESIKKYKGSIA